MSRSSSIDRRVQAYLKPTTHIKFNEYKEKHGMTESELASTAIQEYLSNQSKRDFTHNTRRNHYPE